MLRILGMLAIVLTVSACQETAGIGPRGPYASGQIGAVAGGHQGGGRQAMSGPQRGGPVMGRGGPSSSMTSGPAPVDAASEVAIVKAAGENALGEGPARARFNGIRVVASESDIPVPAGCEVRHVSFMQDGVPYKAHRVYCPPGAGR